MVEARQARPREMTPIGGALARAIHDDPVMSWSFGRSDAARLPDDVPSYDRFGFRVTGMIGLPDGPPLWSTWRDPR